MTPCVSCRGTGFVEDQGWQPAYPESWDGKRHPGDGLIKCGACEGDGKEAPSGIWPDVIAPAMHENPALGWVDPACPDLVLIWRLAREVGYAVGVHGSLKRDFDLIAAPWTDQAVSTTDFVAHMVKGLSASIVGVNTAKPHGRTAVTLQLDGWFKPIDLSILPTQR